LRFHSRIPGAPIAAVLLLALFPFEARLQESSLPAEVVPAPVSPEESGKPTTEQPAPAEPEKKPAAEPRPSSIPEVVITPPPMKRVIVPREPKPAAPVAEPRPAEPPREAPQRSVARGPSARPATTPAPPASSSSAPDVIARPAAQTVTDIPAAERLKEAPAFTVEDILRESPGVSFKQGNGPRDIGISIRGSNARNSFGIRNIVVLEDGFPVTQPDGLSRTDLTDPHAYGSVQVYRGPSSAMFGNYATGGAIDFRLRRGGEINGMIYGTEGGGFGYLNNYALIGNKKGDFEGSIFTSDVRGVGYISHSAFNTQTLNTLMTYGLTPDDRITFKAIDNVLATDLPIRLSLNQFYANPFQRGCAAAGMAAPGCATISLFKNGFAGATVNETAQEAGLGRHDRRGIVAARWEHDFNKDSTWRTQIVFDDKDINQPTGSTSAIGDSPAFNMISDFRSRGPGLFGIETAHYVGFFYNNQRLQNYTYNLIPGGYALLGRLSSYYDGGNQTNWGARAREEIKLSDYWTAVVAGGVEYTNIWTINNILSATAVPVASPLPIARDFQNSAPEAGLLFRPNETWQFRTRAATGYGTPQISNLTVTPAGVSGNNTQLRSQTNLGLDAGVDWTPIKTSRLSVTYFYEFFNNEFVSQSPGAGLQTFTFNVPHSEHRGIEVALDWRPLPGWRLLTAYTHNDQFYTEYTEQLSVGKITRTFNRAGNKIPGVAPNEVATRLGYDVPSGPWKGLGWFTEYVWQAGFFMDNANLLTAPGYGLVNLNFHYDKEITHDWIRSAVLFVEVKNLFDRTYVASANNITNTLDPATGAQIPGYVLANTATGSIYAGTSRTLLAGLKLAFR
jgi:iron complex outermembrane recepter protein